MTAGEAAATLQSRMRGGGGEHDGSGGFHTDVAYRRREGHVEFMGQRDDSDDRSDTGSRYSDASSHGTLRQSPMTVGGSEELSASSYIASTLPEYAERSLSASPPGYSDLSRSQSLETCSDVAVRNSAQGTLVSVYEEGEEGEKGGYLGQVWFPRSGREEGGSA
jgi:hypothetical protein